MTPAQWFTVANQWALAGWGLLVAGLFLPQRWASPVLFFGGRVVPLGLCLAYLVAVLHWWGDSAGGFGSLDAVAQLFTSRGLLLAGWVHYLAFDLLLGRWQVDRTLVAPNPVVRRWFVLPCLFATFMFGPAGLLLYLLVALISDRVAATRKRAP
jgi:hypothetical protein